MTPLIDALQEARAAEKAQALFYRALASLAEDAGDAALSERLNELHADEQHHLSRLTARLLELGARPAPVDDVRAPSVDLAGWAEAAALREGEEVGRYEALAEREMDPATAALLAEILETERHHAAGTGGKWTPA